jgi:hypothetical protein
MNGSAKIEEGRLSDWLLYEEDDIGRFSRENVTVDGGQTLKCGSVVGLNAAGTMYVEYDNVGPDGATAVGIAVNPVTTGVGITGKTVIIARHARIAMSGLKWAASVDQTAKDAAVADLAANGIVFVPSEA